MCAGKKFSSSADRSFYHHIKGISIYSPLAQVMQYLFALICSFL